MPSGERTPTMNKDDAYVTARLLMHVRGLGDARSYTAAQTHEVAGAPPPSLGDWSTVLNVIGYGPDTPSPPGGEIARDAIGRTTGLLLAAPNANLLGRGQPLLGEIVLGETTRHAHPLRGRRVPTFRALSEIRPGTAARCFAGVLGRWTFRRSSVRSYRRNAVLMPDECLFGPGRVAA